MLQRPVAQALARFADLAGTGHTLTETLAIAQDARDGRVEVLLVSADPAVWRPADGRQVIHLDDPEDTIAQLDSITVGAVRRGGTAYPVSPEWLPEHGTVAAILRY
jgi:hypothetical protein